MNEEEYPPKPEKPKEKKEKSFEDLKASDIPKPPKLSQEKPSQLPPSQKSSSDLRKQVSTSGAEKTTYQMSDQPRDSIKKHTRTSPTAQVIKDEAKSEENQKKEKWSFFWWGVLFFFVWNISLMFILELTLNPRDSFLATIIAYSLGILCLVGFSILVRSKLKSILAIPFLFVILYGGGFLFHYLNLPVYNPLAPISENLPSLYNVIELSSLEYQKIAFLDFIVQYIQFSFVLDLLTMLVVFVFGLLALSWFVQIFSSKSNWKTLFTVFFAFIFLVIGLVITPMLHLFVSGTMHIGTNFSAGGLYISEGISIFETFPNASQSEVNEAILNFSLASGFIRDGFQDFKALYPLLQISPLFMRIADDLRLLINVSLILLDGMDEFVNGSFQLFQGFKIVSKALNYTNLDFTYTLLKDEIRIQNINETQFNQGMEQILSGLNLLLKSDDLIENAITEIQEIDFDDFYQTLEKVPANLTEAQRFILDIENYIKLFSDAPEFLRIIIEKPTINGSLTKFPTLSHFLYGAKEIVKTSEVIGENTVINKTEQYLTNAKTNFSIVVEQLSSKDVQNLINSETPFLNDTFRFLYDMSLIASSITDLYLELQNIFDNFELLLSNFEMGYENITNYEILIETSHELVLSTEGLKTKASSLDSNISLIQTKAKESKYGIFSDTATDISETFNDLNIFQDVNNTYNLANSLFCLFNAMRELKIVKESILKGQEEFQNLNFAESQGNFSRAKSSLNLSISWLNSSIIYMEHTVNGGMTQLSDNLNSLITIRDSLISIKDDIDFLLQLAESEDISNADAINTTVDNILDVLNTINANLNEITSQ